MYSRDMTHKALSLVAILGATLAACSATPGEISRDSEPFSAIASEASITALGNEPFWNLTVEPIADGESAAFTATYSTPENIEGSVFPVTRFAGNNGLGLSGELDGQAVSLALTPGDCDDTMSDRNYPYTATLALGDVTLFGCAFTSDQPFTGDEAP